MAVVRFSGFESGASGEFLSITGTVAFPSTGQRTGGFCFQANPTTTGTGSVKFGYLLANGKLSADAGAITTSFTGFAFKAVTLPAANEEPIAIITDQTGGTAKAELRITSGGILKLYGVGSLSLLATGTNPLVAGTYYYLEMKIGNGVTGVYEVRINGNSEFSGTGNVEGTNTGDLRLGKVRNVNGQTVDFYYDDVYLDDAAYLSTTTSFPAVKILLPNAAGGSAGWTNGTGTTFAEVDEVPPESDGTDLTYIQASAVQSSTFSTFRVQSTTTGGVTGTVKAVGGYVWAKTASTAGTSTVSMRVRNVTTNSDTTGIELTTAYVALQLVLATDPATSSAWTLSGVDTVEVGMTAATIAQTQRFSAAYIFVVSVVTTGGGATTGIDWPFFISRGFMTPAFM